MSKCLYVLMFYCFRYMSICTYVHMSLNLKVYVSICIYVYMSGCLNVFMIVRLYVRLSTCLDVYVSICLRIYMSTCLYIYVSVCWLVFVYTSVHRSPPWCNDISISICVHTRVRIPAPHQKGSGPPWNPNPPSKRGPLSSEPALSQQTSPVFFCWSPTH